MQRVEFDEWEVDAITLMAGGGLFHHLTEEKMKLGLDKKKACLWITVAVCCATRCIVGMVISRQPNLQSALRVTELMMRDKGAWTDACGGLTPRNQFGWPSTIVTDCESYNISSLIQARVSDLGITLEYFPTGDPHLKGRIEQVFGTIATQLMPRLSGRTFSNSVKRGDDESEKCMDYERKPPVHRVQGLGDGCAEPYDGQRSTWGTGFPTRGPAPAAPAEEINQPGEDDFSSGSFGTFRFSDHQSGNDVDAAGDDGNG